MDRKSVIAVSPGVSATERFAAEELQRYLHKASGREIPILAEPPARSFAFILGQAGSQWPVYRENKAKLKHDGFLLHCDKEELLIVGNNPRGTLNGVYHLLAEWGFRWIFPRAEEEIVPAQIPWPPPEGTRVVNPDLELRGACVFPVNVENVEKTRAIIDWMGKNRFNLLMTSVQRCGTRPDEWRLIEWKKVSDRLLPELQKRGIMLDVSEHQGRYFFPRKLFARHPEWFAMDAEGKRFSTGQNCYSNEKGVAVLIENYVKYAREHPEVDIIGTWPEDGYGFCQCEGCRQPGVVLQVVNRIAERIEAVNPVMTVEYLSYTAETSDVPPDVLPRRNMSILVANTRLAREWLEKSRRVGGRGVYQLHYHIADNTAERADLPLRFEATGRDCLAAKDLGSRGIIPFYIGNDTWWRSSLNLYFLTQFCWDTSRTARDILLDFCRVYYPAVAEEMVELFSTLEKMPRVNQGVPPPWPLWQDWPTLETDFTGRNWENTVQAFAELHRRLEISREKGEASGIPARRFEAIETLILSREMMFEAWHERAKAVRAFQEKDAGRVREHIIAAARHEKRLEDQYRRSMETDDGVNGAWGDFVFFQNWRLQMDKQLLEMRTEKEKKPFIDNNPEVAMFLPGLLEQCLTPKK